jgi:hypothetical protein
MDATTTQLMLRSIRSSGAFMAARSTNELAAAIRTCAVEICGAGFAKGAFIAADECNVAGPQGLTAPLAAGPHLQTTHAPILTPQRRRWLTIHECPRFVR